MINRRIVLASRPNGVPAPENEKLVDEVAKMVRARDLLRATPARDEPR